MAVDIPDWYKSRIESLQDIDEVRIYGGCEQYVERALESGASLARLDSSPAFLIMPIWDGDEAAVIEQDVTNAPMPDPSYTSYIAVERCDISLNVSCQCAGIPIWEPKRILYHIRCIQCEIPLYRVSDIYRGRPGAVVMCKDCARAYNERYGYED